MITAGLIGIGAALITEAIAWVNKKLNNTPIQGQGAFLVVLGVSFVGALLVAFFQQAGISWTILGVNFATVFATSQVFFYWIMKTTGLTV